MTRAGPSRVRAELTDSTIRAVGRGRVQAEQARRAQQQAAGDDRQDQRGRGTPHGVDEGAAGDERDGHQQTGQRDPVRAVPAEVVDGGFAQADAGPVQRFFNRAVNGLAPRAVSSCCHCSGPYPSDLPHLHGRSHLSPVRGKSRDPISGGAAEKSSLFRMPW